MSSKPRTRPTHPWRRGLRRALGTERNRLARPEDRARSRALLFAALAAGLALLLGAAVGKASFEDAERRAATASEHLHHLDAVLLTPALAAAGASYSGAVDYQATAAWTYPEGQAQSGTVTVDHRAGEGSTIGVWVGDTGRLTVGPPSGADLVAEGVFAGVFVLGGLLVVIASGLGLRLRILNRRADAGWEQGWAELEPVWTGRVRRR
jgi:hypothetical protein